MQAIGDKMAKGATWMVLLRIAERSIGLASTMILARLLLPDDFGLIAMAMSIIAALELMSAFSFDVALIQKQNTQRSHYDTAWTFNIIFGVSNALILVLLAQPAASFFAEPRLEPIVRALALVPLLQGFENVGVVAFRKELTFRKEFNFLLGKKLATFATTVPLAFTLNSHWALIIGIIAGKLFGLCASYVLHAYRPRLCLRERHELFTFSKWILINNILYFIHFRSAHFIIGKIEGARALGFFNISYELSNLATSELIAPINRAVFPGYAKLSSDIDLLRRGYLNVISLIVLFALPIAIGIATSAEILVPVILGENWIQAVPFVQVLAFYGAANSLESNIYAVYLALGRPKVTTVLSMLHVSVMLPSVIILTHQYGVIGAAWAYLLTSLVTIPVKFFVMFRTLQIKSAEFLAAVWRPIIGSFGMMLSVKLYMVYFRDIGQIPDAIALCIAVLVGAATYILIILSLWQLAAKPRSAEYFVLEKVFARFRTRISA